jgi:isoleucyl-tRNA synthetase
MTKFNEINPQPNYKEVESKVLEFWKSQNIFAQSEAKPATKGEFVFYEGPPTANGQPAMHHVLARAFKDLFPRFKTMRGFHVTRKGGWDTHGLPVEIAVEKKLGLTGRNHGATRAEMEEFNKLCRESVFANIQEWNTFTERMGYWVDLEHPYVTYHNDYIESVWNLLKRLWQKGLVERDYKVVPVSPRIGTTLSANEIADGYRDVNDPSVYVRLPIKLETMPKAFKAELEKQNVNLENLENPALVVWTTTPWTLPSNTLAAVNAELEYVLANSPQGHVIVAAGAVERMSLLYKDLPPLEVVARFKGSVMEFLEYHQPFPESFEELKLEGKAHFVALAGFVTDDDGSGVAHEAPVYGAEDLALGRAYGAPLCFGTDKNGIMQVTEAKGKFFKDADKDLIRIMKERGVMYHAGQLLHSYPFHDRTGDPILYFARPSWFVRTNKMRANLAAQNQKINWYPQHIKDGRFGNWLENNVDWSISRERYWGTPLPFWKSEDGDLHVVGSVKELSELTGRDLSSLDLHRPFVDDITFELNGKTFSRVPEVLDVWFDSGSMPSAQWHLLLEADGTAQSQANLETFKKHFPADFICEAVDQTRGWFYSLHAISTLLYDSPAYKNVICLGHLVDEKGKKMSKSLGNVVDPLPAFDKFGADSVRWYMFTASEPGDTKRFSERLVSEGQRGFVNTLWNVYSFFVLYANIDNPDLNNAPKLEQRLEIDRWLISRLEQTKEVMTKALDHYDARGGGKALDKFVMEMSNWYVRRNRRRFWSQDGNVDLSAYATLYEALVTCAKLAAPFTPFLAESLYQNLVRNQDNSAPESVHLCDWTEFDASRCDLTLVSEMNAVLTVVELGRAARAKASLGNRQPLPRALVYARNPSDVTALIRLKDVALEELNVEGLEFLEEVNYKVRPNLPVLGKTLPIDAKKLMPQITAELAKPDLAQRVAENLNAGKTETLTLEGISIELTLEKVLIDAEAPAGFESALSEGFLVALDTNLTPELKLEGLKRFLVRMVNQARKDAKLEVSDKIALRLELEGELLQAAQEKRESLALETMCSSIEFTEPQAGDFVVALEDGGRLGLRKV